MDEAMGTVQVASMGSLKVCGKASAKAWKTVETMVFDQVVEKE